MPGKIEYRIKNFRSFEDSGSILIKPLTVVVGANNSGKSSLIAPLLLLAQTMRSRDPYSPIITRGELVDIGDPIAFLHNHDTSKSLEITLNYDVRNPPKKEEKIGMYPPGGIKVDFRAKKKRREVELSKYIIYDVCRRKFLQRNLLSTGRYSTLGIDLQKMTKPQRFAIMRSTPINFFFTVSETLYYLEKLTPEGKSTHFTLPISEKSTQFDHYIARVNSAYRSIRLFLDGVTYIGPIRNRLGRYYEVLSEHCSTVGTTGQYTGNIIHHQLNASEKRKLNKWVREFGFGESVNVHGETDDVFSLYFGDPKDTSSYNIADAGFGASQILPIIVQSLIADSNSLTIAEQPEIHLNPALQSKLADLFATLAIDGRHVIVETHSEHFLLRLRRLIAQGNLSKDDVALYFVEKEDGVSKIKDVPISDLGHISPSHWPKGFFGESLKESLALAADQTKSKRNRQSSRKRKLSR